MLKLSTALHPRQLPGLASHPQGLGGLRTAPHPRPLGWLAFFVSLLGVSLLGDDCNYGYITQPFFPGGSWGDIFVV